MDDSYQPDTALLKRARRGDAGAIRALVERHQEFILRIAFRVSGDFHRAEEISQDAFVRGFRHLSTYKPSRGSFRSWLGTIAKNEALNSLRKSNPTPVEIPADAAGSDGSPSENSERRDAFREIDAAVAKLGEPFRTTFLLVEIEDFSLREVAEIESVSIGTIKSRLSRARASLRSTLTPPSELHE